ncbi:FlxA-like family protein [Herbaspirillum sp. LeCh32-8]|uniref:FlxA-like family protein n=1 Tax=Herbaspirillum sp. LeCh32-8 TaxID=2821356 RepID=UPI001AE8C081|nr:FlxA-like family protein [Herbaspirillum sp. LeCh32-8]MBP0600147.1 FlxA-like family protein [Herbaspirillum sp. LeCh32-8]
MAILSELAENEMAVEHPVTDTLDNDPSELIAELSNRIVILQQQAQSLARFPSNKDGKQQRNLLQQQIRSLYQQIFLLEQQHARSRNHGDNYLSMALSVAAHTAHAYSRDVFTAG